VRTSSPGVQDAILQVLGLPNLYRMMLCSEGGAGTQEVARRCPRCLVRRSAASTTWCWPDSGWSRAAPLVSELLTACPKLRVVVTGRASLRLRWEQELLVSPLALPDLQHATTPSELARAPSVAPFAERARMVRHDFTVGPVNARAVAGRGLQERWSDQDD
jgi:hypothetical protein